MSTTRRIGTTVYNRSTDIQSVADAGNGQSSGTTSQHASESAPRQRNCRAVKERIKLPCEQVNNSATQHRVSNPPVATTERHTPQTDMTVITELQTTSPNQISLSNQPQRLRRRPVRFQRVSTAGQMNIHNRQVKQSTSTVNNVMAKLCKTN